MPQVLPNFPVDNDVELGLPVEINQLRPLGKKALSRERHEGNQKEKPASSQSALMKYAETVWEVIQQAITGQLDLKLHRGNLKLRRSIDYG